MIGGPGEQKLIKEISQARPHAHLVTINAPLAITQFAAFAAQFDVMLCHDQRADASSPPRRAVPVVALFGSQSATVWRPIGKNHLVLQPPLPCVNCVSFAVCVPGDSYRIYCVRNITVEQVIAAIAVPARTAASRRPINPETAPAMNPPDGLQEAPLISFGIPAYNLRPHLLAETLASIAAQNTTRRITR